MKTPLLLILFLSIAKFGFAQRDTINMPLHNGKLEYTGTITLANKTPFQLDTTAKGWFDRSFKYKQLIDSDINSSVLAKGALQFRMTTTSLALVKYTFFLCMDIQIDCKENSYTYKISNIYFTPKNAFFRKVIIHENSPEFLIDLYNKKHMALPIQLTLEERKCGNILREQMTPF